jgi:hypothetical protein
MFFAFFIWFEIHIQPFYFIIKISFLIRSQISDFKKSRIVSDLTIFNLKNFVNIRTGRFLSQCVDCAFKSTIELNHDILGLLDKFTISVS